MEIGTGYGGGGMGRSEGAMGSPTTEDLKQKATGLGESARAKAMGRLDANKEQVCSLLDRVADGVQDERLGRYAADYARRGASYLRRQSSEDLVASARAELRERPGLLLSACFVAGMALARMIRR